MTQDYEYKVGGSLAQDAPSYVVRQADDDLYHGLKDSEFCYVFNSRQMGKTSLQVRIMKRLQAEGIACTKIDVSGQGIQNINPEQWYGGIVYTLVKDFELANPSEFLRSWWRDRIDLSPVRRLGEFIEEVMLVAVQTNIVIFIDEIDSILSLNFPSDDFFAFIRSCYEQRTRNSEYNRLTFALIGVATPSVLITDKRRTPFNIGKAIQLKGFQLHEIEPLSRGLEGKVDDPQTVIKEVLAWTGGQPFLTQKLCQIIGSTEWGDEENSQSKISTPRQKPGNELKSKVKQLVRSHIIENWEGQDEPPHLKTIRDRILMRERRASVLLGLYQQILHSSQGGIVANDSPEQIELRLSGLVVEQQGALRVYNRIYESVFNLNWVEKELANLRPYAEVFTAWVNSNYQDESRLLRGQALQDALKWASGKSLSNVDYQFLADSQELDKREIENALAVKEEENRILAQAKETLTKAQQKAKWQIHIGAIILTLSIIGAVVAGIFAGNAIIQAREAQEGANLELAGVSALQQFESQEIEALLSAMDAGQRLQELVKDGRPLEKYPTTSPIRALQTILDNIHEQTQLSWHQDVNNVSFSPDGRLIVTASNDKTARVWDLSGNQIAVFVHQAPVNSARFSPDGQRILTLSIDGTVRVWNLSGKQIAVLPGDQYDVKMYYDDFNSASFSPDGQRIVIADRESFITKSSNKTKTARVWDLSSKQITVLSGHQGLIYSVSFSPDGQRIVTASEDKTARMWDLSGKQIVVLFGHQGSVNSVSFSPDGQHIVTASADETARVWDLSGKQIAVLSGHRGFVNSASFSPDGQRILTVSREDNTARVWDLSGKQIAVLSAEHLNYFISASFSPDGQLIVTGSNDKTAKVWDLSGKQIAVFVHQAPVNSARFSPDGQRILTISEDKTARAWDYLSGKQIVLSGHWYFSRDGRRILNVSDVTARAWDYLSGKQIVLFGSQGFVGTASFSSDGQRILTDDGTARVWDLSRKQIVVFVLHEGIRSASFSPDGQHILSTSHNDGTAQMWDLSSKQIVLFGDQSFVNSASFSPNGQRIVTASVYGTARVWDLSGKQIAVLSGHHDRVNSASFSPDGQHIVTASHDGTARVWDLYSKQIAVLSGHQSLVKSASFSPDGQRIVTASADKTARVWDLSGKQIAVLSGHQDFVNTASFSPDGQCILTASDDKTARVWDLSGKQIAVLFGHQDRVISASFSPDGQRILTASVDKTARVWDLSGKQIAVLSGHHDRVNSASFSPDGQRIITASSDGTARVWRVGGLDELLTRGCDWLKDYLASHPEAQEKLKVCHKSEKL
jgi:WD40 repeat protein